MNGFCACAYTHKSISYWNWPNTYTHHRRLLQMCRRQCSWPSRDNFCSKWLVIISHESHFVAANEIPLSSNKSIDHLKRDFHFVLIHLVETMVVAANAHVINCFFSSSVLLLPPILLLLLLFFFQSNVHNGRFVENVQWWWFEANIYVCILYTYIEGGDKISRCKRFTWIRAELNLSEWIRESWW